MPSAIKILAISGSLRKVSTNTTLLQAARVILPADVEISLYDGLDSLPHFNPDLEDSAPASVIEFRDRIKAADGILICSPEYAHGVPGVLKNALDWIVGSGELVDKPVALWNASPRATLAQASLAETIRVMSAKLVSQADIPLMGVKLDAAALAAHPELSGLIRSAIADFAAVIRR